MIKQSSKKKETIRLIVVNSIMALSVIVIATFVTLFMLGYRFSPTNGNLVQYAFMQFSSTPSGATVTVDGKSLGIQTPTKTSVPAGKHDVTMWRDGYKKWSKTVNLKAGTLMWLNYTLLVPEKLTVESINKYESIYRSLASSDGSAILVQSKADSPQFDIVDDTSSDKTKTVQLTIPATTYSVGVSHIFTPVRWDEGGRYVLVRHVYDSKSEWLVVDTQNVSLTKNISQSLDVAIDETFFDGTGGNNFYVLAGKDVRAINLSAGTISKPLISNVISFDYYHEAKVITYVGTSSDGKSTVVGVYRKGDESASVVKAFAGTDGSDLHMVTARYYNEDYIAISQGKDVQIMTGSYPNTTDNNSSMKTIASFTASENIKDFKFSPSGQYLIAKNGAYFVTYDLEYQTKTESVVGGNGELGSISWLDENHLWSDRDSKLTIRDFDGKNVYMINPVMVGQDAMITKNGRYLYSLNKVSDGYQLQRVRMILP